VGGKAMHGCLIEPSHDAIDGCATGIGATRKPVGATAAAIVIAISDAGPWIALVYYVAFELSTAISSDQNFPLSRSGGGL
jgi:hypothetical protein